MAFCVWLSECADVQRTRRCEDYGFTASVTCCVYCIFAALITVAVDVAALEELQCGDVRVLRDPVSLVTMTQYHSLCGKLQRQATAQSETLQALMSLPLFGP